MRAALLFSGLSLCCFLFTLACGATKKESSQANEQKELWHGRWQWQETRYVRRTGESLETPAEKGVEMEIELLPDGKLKVYHNKALMQTHDYQVRKIDESLLIEVSYNKERLDPDVESGPLRCSANSLEIIGGYNDAGGNQKFRRMQ